MKRFLLVLFLLLILAIPIQAQGPIYLPIITKGDSCMGIAKLAISDGTTEISLLDLKGIHLAEDDGWTPKIIQAKSGGVFQDSSMAAGRRLVYHQFGTAREDFTFNIMGISQDELIAQTSDLLMMLEKAVNYWATDWQSDIVYLIAQSDCETYARYAPILYYEAQELQNPYGQPFVQAGDGAIFDDIGIMIERSHWQDVAPGSSTCVLSNSIQAWEYQAKWIENTALPVDGGYSLLQTANGYIYSGDNGQIWRSVDDGANWAVNTVLPSGIVYSLFQAGNGYIFAGDDGQILRSIDNGANWTVVSVAPTTFVRIIAQSRNRIFAGDDGQIWYSDDDGANWTNVVLPTPNDEVTGIIPFDDRNIIYLTSGVSIMKSTDNGLTWSIISRIQSETDALLWKLAISNDKSILYIGTITLGNPPKLYISKDNGTTWTLIKDDFAANAVYALMVDSNDGIYVGDTGSIWYTPDLITWTQVISGLVNSIESLIEANEPAIYAGRTATGSIYKNDLSTVDMGADDSCSNIVYVGNRHNEANLTNVKIDDGGVFTDIFPMAAFPTDLYPANLAVGDALYFGSDTTIINSGPFSGLVFDIYEPIPAITSYTITWEYYNGGWVALTTHDGTNEGAGSFSAINVTSIHWNQPSDWTTVAVDGITGYWVRGRVSAKGVGAVTPPSQQNRQIYAINRGYIDTSDVTGDISALLKLDLQNRSDADGPAGGSPNLYENRLLVGLRSYDRGENFQSYTNLSDEQNPDGVTISVGTSTTIGTDILAPSGRSATYNPGGVEAMATRVTITLGSNIARDFYGTYHAFLRVQRTAGASTDFNVQLVFVTGSGGIQKTTESKQVQTTTAFELLDFGQVTIPVGGSLASTDLGDQIQILIQASAASGVPNLVLYDLILIPVDEWTIDSVDQTNSSTSDIGRSGDIQKLLDIDSVTDPKNPIKSIVRQVGSDFVTANYNPITNGPAILQSNVDQRLWFLAAQTSATGSSYSWIAPPEICHSVQLFKSQRYLGLRGNR